MYEVFENNVKFDSGVDKLSYFNLFKTHQLLSHELDHKITNSYWNKIDELLDLESNINFIHIFL